ncbi:DUF932 domain-containing protein [Paraburkholderia youngii]|uniref:DUF932 domain-containing protein n=1 Tax=Paraburkholderia youngii TaxID=2782701 RepID=UPI003D1B079A
MSHLLSMTQQGFVEMAYAGQVPWHGLGQRVERGASIEEWRAAAGLTWHVVRAPMSFTYGGEHGISTHNALVRSDNAAHLSIVTKKYHLVQPAELLEFFRDLTNDVGFSVETVGVLKGGKTIWVLARTGFEDEVVGEDKVRSYVLLMTTYDTTMSTTAQFTSVRVVCNNTLQMAMRSDARSVIRIPHTREFDADAVKEELGVSARPVFDSFMTRMRALADVKLSSTDFADLLVNIFADPSQSISADDVRKKAGYRRIMQLFNGQGRGSNMDGVKYTAWGALNAVTQYVDHEKRAHTADNRLESAWAGDGAVLKDRAVTQLLAIA